MGQWAYHWLYQDLWIPLWPNLAASLVVYVFMWVKLRSMQKMHAELKEMHLRHHAEQMQAIRSDTPKA